MKYAYIIIAIGILFLSMPQDSQAAPLTAGATYTITVEAVLSNGTVTSTANGNSLGLSTTAVADANGKISFSFSGVPTSGSYNFLVVTIKDSNGDTVRRSIVPCPASGATTNLGVSPMTEQQTEAMLSAMQTAVTDDPIMVLFGFIIIRSGAYTSADITHLANCGRLGIINGFNVYLEGKIGTTKMALFKSAIVSRLGNYCSNLKQSVDAATDAVSKNERAEAAALLSQILIEAAAAADFDVGYINAAMKAASDQVEDYLLGAGADMNEAAVNAMDKVMMSNYMKLSAECVRKKYTAALTTLNASQDQITRLNNAITTLSNSLLAAFQEMEELFQDEETMWTDSDVDTKFNECNTSINNAFNQFMSDIAATNAEIDTMVTSMSTGFSIPIATLNTMKDPNSDGTYTDGIFKFWSMGGTEYNWPITMVVPVTWIADNYGNNLTYTRDTLGVPTAMGWLDSDDNPDNGINNTRHDWDTTNNNGVAGDEKSIPAGLAALFSLREDVEIIMARKWAGLVAASKDMTQAGYDKLSGADLTLANNQITASTLTVRATENGIGNAAGTLEGSDDLIGAGLANFNMLGDLSPWLTGYENQGLEDLALTRLNNIESNITVAAGYTITDAQKQALMDTAAMPDFH